MNILKNIARAFSGGGAAPTGDVGMYFYVKCHRCGEVVKVRLNRMNDLSRQDNDAGQEGNTLFARKVIVGQRCYNRMEAEFTFDANRKLTHKEVMGGVFVDEADYFADQDKSTAAGH